MRPPQGSSGHAYKEGNSSCQETHNSGILQRIIPGTQTLEKVQTSDRFKYSEQSFACTYFQNGNSRICQEVDSTGGVGHRNRPNRHLFKRPARDACLCMGDLQAPHFVFLITL